MIIFEVYRALMVMADMLECMSHGANDVANSISPFLEILQIEGDKNFYGYLIGSFGISLGLLTFG